MKSIVENAEVKYLDMSYLLDTENNTLTNFLDRKDITGEFHYNISNDNYEYELKGSSLFHDTFYEYPIHYKTKQFYVFKELPQESNPIYDFVDENEMISFEDYQKYIFEKTKKGVYLPGEEKKGISLEELTEYVRVSDWMAEQ